MMKKTLIFLLILVISLSTNAQYTFVNNIPDSSRIYNGSYTFWSLYKLKDSFHADSAYMRIDGNLGILRVRSNYNDGSPNCILWADDYGWVKRSPITSIGVSFNQIVNGLNYIPLSSLTGLTTLSGDARYLRTEIDGSIINELQNLSLNGFNLSITNGNFVTIPIPTDNSQLVNGSQYITSITSQTLGDNRYWKLTQNIVTNVGINSTTLSVSNTPITISGNIVINLSTSGVSQGNYFGTYTVNQYGIVTTARNITVNTIPEGTILGRSFNTGYRLSTISGSTISISVDISCSLSLSGGTEGNVYLDKSPDNSNWVFTGKRLHASNTGALTIGLNTVQISSCELTTYLPAGYYWRLRTVNTTGTPTYSFLGGEEIIY